MSGYTSAYVTCDGRDPGPDPKVPDKPCPASVKGGQQPDGEWVFPATVTAARKMARKLGWTFVRWPHRSGSSLAHDYCPGPPRSGAGPGRAVGREDHPAQAEGGGNDR